MILGAQPRVGDHKTGTLPVIDDLIHHLEVGKNLLPFLECSCVPYRHLDTEN